MATEEETKTALPPYPEMIVAAIKALNEESGSSKTAISKHIESEHGDLPAGHATLLAHHLNKMKSNGELVLANDSYKLPDPNTPAKRGRGRPPKPKTPGTPASVKTTSPKPRGRPPKPKDPASESAKKAASGTPKRGRGRPPKEGGSATPSAKKAKTSKPAASPASTPGSKRGRGRPPKVKPEAATNVVGSD